jgi:hypothetical protein
VIWAVDVFLARGRWSLVAEYENEKAAREGAARHEARGLTVRVRSLGDPMTIARLDPSDPIQ